MPTRRIWQTFVDETEWCSYRMCQGLWPSLMFADEDIKPQNFWASSKSHVATTYLCMYFCCNYIGWSNQGKHYEIEIYCAKQNVATWLYDEANIFQFDVFVWKHRLTTWVTIPDKHGIKSHLCFEQKGRWNRTFILFYQEFTSNFFVQKIFKQFFTSILVSCPYLYLTLGQGKHI